MRKIKSQTDKIVLRDGKEVEEFLTHLEKAWELTIPQRVDSYGFLIHLGSAASGEGRFLPSVGPTLARRVLLKGELAGSTPSHLRQEILQLLGEFFWWALFLSPEMLWKGVRRTLLLPPPKNPFEGFKMRRLLGEGGERRRLAKEARPSKIPFLQIYKARTLRDSSASKELRGFVLSVGTVNFPTRIHLRYAVDFPVE